MSRRARMNRRDLRGLEAELRKLATEADTLASMIESYGFHLRHTLKPIPLERWSRGYDDRESRGFFKPGEISYRTHAFERRHEVLIKLVTFTTWYALFDSLVPRDGPDDPTERLEQVRQAYGLPASMSMKQAGQLALSVVTEHGLDDGTADEDVLDPWFEPRIGRIATCAAWIRHERDLVARVLVYLGIPLLSLVALALYLLAASSRG